MPLFDKRELYRHRKSINAPQSVVERVEKIAKAEDTSENQAWIALTETGADVWGWMERHTQELAQVRKAYDLTDRQLAIRLMVVGLEIFKKDAKTWKAFAFALDLKMPL